MPKFKYYNGTSWTELLTNTDVRDQLLYTIMSATTVAGSGNSGSYLSVRWHVNGVGGITTPFDGMKIAIKIPKAGVSTAGVVLSLNGNTASDYHPVAYNVNTVFTTHFGVGAIKVLVYDATATMACYLTSNTKTTVTGVWKFDADYDSNTTVTYGTNMYYFRAYAAQAIYRYKFLMLDKDNRFVPLTTTNVSNGTAVTNITPTALSFKPDKIYWYNGTGTVSAGAVIGAQTVLGSSYNANNATNGGMAICNFNETVPAYRMIYLCGTYNKTTGLFTLRDGGTASSKNYYKFVPNNTTITLSSYFTTGYDYILLGGTYSSNNYIQLFDNNPMFHFDGTNLVPYETWNAEQKVPTSGEVISIKADNGIYLYPNTSGAITDYYGVKLVTTSTDENKVVTFPNKSGTVAMTSDIPSVSNATITVKQAGRNDQTFTLNGSATTINLDNTTYSNATQSAAGLMSSTDKTRLDNIYTALNGTDSSKIDTIAEVYSFLDDYAQTTDLATQLATKVPTSRKVNGHALTGDISVTASDVGLGNVLNKAITVTSTSVSDGTNTFNKYTHPTTTAVSAAAKKVGYDSYGHVVLGAALTASDVGARPSTWTPTASDVGALPTGTTLDSIADGSTRKLANYLPKTGATEISSDFSLSTASSKSIDITSGRDITIKTNSSSGNMTLETDGNFYLVTNKGGAITEYYGVQLRTNSDDNTGTLVFDFPTTDGTLATQEWVDDQGYVTNNYYPSRSYTSGLSISTGQGTTSCSLYVPYASSSQIGAIRVAAGTGISVSYSSGVCTVTNTGNAQYIKTFWFTGTYNSKTIELRVTLTTNSSTTYSGSSKVSNAFTHLRTITNGYDIHAGGYYAGNGAIQQIKVNTSTVQIYYVNASGNWYNITVNHSAFTNCAIYAKAQ